MPRKSLNLAKLLPVALLFIVPYGLIYTIHLPHFVGRAIGIAIFVFFMTPWIFWFGLSPKSAMIRLGGKLSQPQFDQIRPRIERSFRILVVSFGVLFSIYVTVPLVSDLAELIERPEPAKTTAVVTKTTVPFLGLWFLNQSLYLATNSGETHPYRLFYSYQMPHIGETYEFVIFSHSRCILDFSPANK
jgi:hypothetical protein